MSIRIICYSPVMRLLLLLTYSKRVKQRTRAGISDLKLKNKLIFAIKQKDFLSIAIPKQNTTIVEEACRNKYANLYSHSCL